ncbi:hypothetical protein SAMN02745866_03566 [Alteromonadaceae bacterium Bs31]|nr:hypothetical protein SAMN02745866_03566 [Alteromonadaceae bacterium Bs31]
MKPLTSWARAAVVALPFFSFSTAAGEVKAYIGAEGRYFFNEPLSSAQEEHSTSLSANIEFFHDYDNDEQRIAITAFGRADSVDNNRTHLDLREAYWWKGFDQFEVYLGLRKIFWGVTESVHLVDIINQKDVLENIDGEQKLGQGMLQLVSQRDWGLLELFVMPHFREQQFPGEKARLRSPLAIAEQAIYQSDKGDQHVDFAVSWNHYFGVFDMSLSHFSGTNRNPLFIPSTQEGNEQAFQQTDTVLQALYQQIHQTGLTVQATAAEWLWKLEAISIEEQHYGRNSAAVAGLEYTLFTLFNSNADLGLIAEYQFDDRTGIRETFAQNDLALGLRWAFNDIDGSELLAIASHDFDYHTQFVSLELGRRITDDWRIEAEARFFVADNPEAPSYALRQDDYIQLELRRYF